MNIKEKLGGVLKQSVFLARTVVGAGISRVRWFVFTSKGRRLASWLVVAGTVGFVAAARPVTVIGARATFAIREWRAGVG